MQATSSESRNPDGIVFGQEENRCIPLVLLEYEGAIGEGGCDPSIGETCSLRELIFKDEVRAFTYCTFVLRSFDTSFRV